MKKYARLRSTSCSFPEHCEYGEEPEANVSTTFADSSGSKWSSLKLSPPVHVTKQGHGDDEASCSSSHRVLADALKKLSSLRETQYDDDPLPRGVAATGPSWGGRIVSDSDAGGGSDQLHSTSFVSGNNWQRPRSAIGSEFQSNSISSNGGAAAGSIVRTKTGCTYSSHFAHRRSSSMHDVTTEARPSASSGMATISGLEGPWQPAKLKGARCFPDHAGSEQWSPPQLRTRSPLPVTASANSPLQAKSCSLWEENEDPKQGRWSGRRAGVVQSLRYDRLQSAGSGADLRFKELERSAPTAPRELQSQSVREGTAHAQAIAAMAKAYAEKYGVAQAVVECVACGRGLGVIVEGNSPGSYDSSFCRSCRPPVQQLPGATAASSSSSSSSWKKLGGSRGMMHYCRKLLLRMGGKKPGSHKYTMV